MRKVLFRSAVAMTAAAFVVGFAAPAMAYDNANYDGYCYAKKSNKERDDALKGAAIGAAAGAIFGKKKKKVQTAVIGAAVGAGVGYVVAKNSKEKIDCSGGRYYVYTGSYYDPTPADEGSKIVFFETRPANVTLYTRDSSGQDVPYSGH